MVEVRGSLFGWGGGDSQVSPARPSESEDVRSVRSNGLRGGGRRIVIFLINALKPEKHVNNI
jgi:hypothetical protein